MTGSSLSRQTAFTCLFWGFLFQLLNFYVQHVNLLPDIIGFILTAIAAHRLREESSHFQVVYWLTFPLILVSWPNIHQVSGVGPGIQISAHVGGVFYGVLSFLEWGLAIALVYQVCKGLGEIAQTHGVYRLAESSRIRWTMYLWLQIGVAVMFLLVLFPSAFSVFMVIVLLIYSIIVAIAFLVLIWACRNQLA